MKKVIPSKPGTQNTQKPVPDPFGGPLANPFGRLTVEDRDAKYMTAAAKKKRKASEVRTGRA